MLVHGITESRRAWDPLLAPLGEHHTVVAIDMRGHGESSRADTYDSRAMAADVAAVVAAEELDPPLLVGHSMGGIVVTACAAAGHPTRGVVNIDQSLALGGFQELVRSVEPMLRGEGFHELMAGFIDSLQGPLPADEVARLAALRLPDQEVVLGVWAPLLELSADALDDLVRGLTAAIHAPYLALHGSDPGVDYGEWLPHRIPGAHLEVWEDHGHFPHLVDPERFVARIRIFDPATA